jgi:hypothetical protein
VIGEAGTVAEWTETGGWTSPAFQSLLSETVVAAVVQSPRVLEFRFESGLALELHDDDDRYESMQIYLPGEPAAIIV